MSSPGPDYDTDPGRSPSFRAGWQVDVHTPVADRLATAAAGPVLDVGCGIGRFRTTVGERLAWVGVDTSPRQLDDCPHRPVIRADGRHLPFPDGAFGAVTMLWMLHYLDVPERAVAEAWRVLRPGGLLVTSADSRYDDPELVPDGRPPTSFDAEDAADIVTGVFGRDNVEVERWDAPMVRLADRAELAAYAVAHRLDPDMTTTVDPPLVVTKRGCLVWARRDEQPPPVAPGPPAVES